MDLLNLLLLLLRPLKREYAAAALVRQSVDTLERERVDGAVGGDAFFISNLGKGW